MAAHEKALEKVLASSQELSVEFLCSVHKILCEGQGTPEAGQLRTMNVRVGPDSCCPPEHIRPNLEALVVTANQILESVDTLPCIEVAAALISLRILDIHPFRDGNGRLSRIVLNWVLARCGVPFVICLCSTPEQRKDYTDSTKWLSQAKSWKSLKWDENSFAQMRQHLKKTVRLIQEHMQRAWDELERLRVRLVATESDAQRDAAVSRVRQVLDPESHHHNVNSGLTYFLFRSKGQTAV